MPQRVFDGLVALKYNCYGHCWTSGMVTAITAKNWAKLASIVSDFPNDGKHGSPETKAVASKLILGTYTPGDSTYKEKSRCQPYHTSTCSNACGPKAWVARLKSAKPAPVTLDVPPDATENQKKNIEKKQTTCNKCLKGLTKVKLGKLCAANDTFTKPVC